MITVSQLLILGCGSSDSIESFNSNAIVLTNSGNMLIDCGHTIKHALDFQNMDFRDIDSIYISHVHGDHVYGLERVAYETKFSLNKRVKLYFHESLYTELWDQTLKGSLGHNSDGSATLDDYFDVELITSKNFSCHGNNYELVKVMHTPGKPVFGLCINENIFYSSDTLAIPDTIKKLKFTTGFHDVILNHNNPVHADLESLIKTYPKEIRKKLYLMNYEDTWQEHEELVLQEFKGFAKRGMRLNV